MRGAIPGRGKGRGGYTWSGSGLRRAETGREGLGIVGTPIPGPGLPRVHLEPGRNGVLSRHWAGRRTVLVRDGGQSTVEGELISRRKLGDNFIMNPWKRTLRGGRTGISVVGGTEIVLRDGGMGG